MPDRRARPPTLLVAAAVACAAGCDSPEERLAKAARDGDLSAVTALLADGADPNARPEFTDNHLMAGPHPRAALQEAIVGGSPDVVAALLAAGADPNRSLPGPLFFLPESEPAADGWGGWWSPLRTAAQCGDRDAAALLLAAGASRERLAARLADVAQGNRGQSYPNADRLGLLRDLLAAGADPDGVPARRPLGEAVRYGETALAAALLEAGADPLLPDAEGLRAVDRLPPHGFPRPGARADLLDLLRSHGHAVPPAAPPGRAG